MTAAIAAGDGATACELMTAPEVVISGNPPSSAEAKCDYGAFLLELTDEGWRVNSPWCVT